MQDSKTTTPQEQVPEEGITVSGVTLTPEEAKVLLEFNNDPLKARGGLIDKIGAGKGTDVDVALLNNIVMMDKLADYTKEMGPDSTRKTRAKFSAEEANRAEQAGETHDSKLAAKMKAAVRIITEDSNTRELASRRVQVMMWSRQVPPVPAKEQCRRLDITMGQWRNDQDFIKEQLIELSSYAGASEEDRKTKIMVEMESDVRGAEAMREVTNDLKQKLAWTREIRQLRAQFVKFLFDCGKIPRVAAKVEFIDEGASSEQHAISQYQARLEERFRNAADKVKARQQAPDPDPQNRIALTQ